MMRWAPILVAVLLLAPCSLAAETFVLLSDLNGRYGSTDYNDRVLQAVQNISVLQPDAVIITGDMVAGQKQPDLDSGQLDLMWNVFNDTVYRPLERAGVPVLITPGNHDASALPGFDLERERFAAHWSSRPPGPALLPGSEWPWRYAAMLGDVLLVAFDGTWPRALPRGEREFLEKVLSAHSNEARATVVFSHLPLWPLARGRESETLDDPQLLSLMHRHGVDVYASGHHHVAWAGVDSAGMLHVSVGALGGGARAFSGQSSRQAHGFTLLFLEDGEMTIEMRAAPGFESVRGAEGLPATITGPLGTLQRLDGPVPLRD